MSVLSSEIGTVIISLDFEIGWGDVTNGVWRRREANGVFPKLRSVLPEILQAMDDYEIPVSWATVGAMFEQPGKRDFAHLKDNQAEIVSDALSTSKESTFDGRDLFEQVLNSKQKHAIACHSYSHVPFDYEGFAVSYTHLTLPTNREV